MHLGDHFRHAVGTGVRVGRERDGTALRRGLDGVADEVHEDLLQQRRIAQDDGQCRGQAFVDDQARLIDAAGGSPQGAADHAVDVERHDLPLGGSDRPEQVLQTPFQAIHFADDLVQAPAAVRQFGPRPPVKQRDLRRGADIGERVANAVGDGGHHLTDRRHALGGHELLLDRT